MGQIVESIWLEIGDYQGLPEAWHHKRNEARDTMSYKTRSVIISAVLLISVIACAVWSLMMLVENRGSTNHIEEKLMKIDKQEALKLRMTTQVSNTEIFLPTIS